MTKDAGGTYALLLYLDEGLTERVGSLGNVRFPRGNYVYAGSAAVSLAPRLLRHAKDDKVVHWHVDRLTTTEECTVVGAITFGSGGPTECEIVGALTELPWVRVEPPGFGASDHRCPGHLVQLGERPEVTEGAIEILEALGGHWLSFDGIERPGGP